MWKLLTTSFAVLLLTILLPSITRAQDSIYYADLISKVGGELFVEGAVEIFTPKALELHQEGVLFIDVNTITAYNAGHIPGAVALDIVGTLTEASLAENATKDQTIVFYCPHPACWGAARASAKAIVWGYTNVMFYEGGADAWTQAGLAVEKG